MATFIGSFMMNFWAFLFFRALVGIGEASYSTIAPAIISDLFTKDTRSRVLALFYFAIPVGTGLGYIIGKILHNSLWNGLSQEIHMVHMVRRPNGPLKQVHWIRFTYCQKVVHTNKDDHLTPGSFHLSFFVLRHFRRRSYQNQLSFSGKDSTAHIYPPDFQTFLRPRPSALS